MMAREAQQAFDAWGRAGRQPYAPGAGLPGLRAFGESRSVDGGTVAFELFAGDPLAPQGPFVRVRTALTGAASQGGVLPVLEEMLEDERDRLFDHTGVDEGERPREAREEERLLRVDGAPVAAWVRTEGPGANGGAELWAARLAVCQWGGPLEITVVVRGLPVGEVTLEAVADPSPYLLGREEWLDAVRARRSERARAGDGRLPVVLGLEVHRHLALVHMEATRPPGAQPAGRRRARTPRRLRTPDRADSWELAVRQQMRLGSETRAEAQEAISSMVNQLGRLAHEVGWAVGTDDGRQAVEETLRHTVFGSEVPSLPAQLAWQAAWRGQRSAWAADQQVYLFERWLTAWESWRCQRSTG